MRHSHVTQPGVRVPGPVDVFVVRHGESIGNVAVRRVADGDMRWLPVLTHIESTQWPLTTRGRRQAGLVGAFLRQHTHLPVRFFYSSHFIRARETAEFLQIPSARWRVDRGFGERDIGERFTGITTLQQFRDRIGDERRRENADVLLHRPPGGETLLELRDRVGECMRVVEQRHPSSAGIIVCHGEVMWAMRALLEGFDDEQWRHALRSAQSRATSLHPEMILNGHLFWVSHRDPTSGQVRFDRRWMRRVCVEHLVTDTGWYEVPRHQLHRNVAESAPVR